ncbi:MAG TPA: methyltransferase domain-containing protein [Longimicrobiales bacterium]|nr:methyltransferase domain-containing protein [Longimicrobiales bacterium]
MRRLVLQLTEGRVADRHPLNEEASRIERLRRWARFEEAEQRRDHAALEEAHRLYWSGPDGAAWHEAHGYRFHTWFLEQHGPLMDAVEALLRDEPRFDRLVELGTGDARALAHLAARLPALRALIGVDLSQATIEANQARHWNTRLGFVCEDLVEYLEREAAPGTVYLTNGGVFEYVARHRVERLLRAIAARPPAALALVEPLDEDMDPDVDGRSRVIGFEHTFAHPYPALLRRHGFRIVHRRQLRVEPWRVLEAVAVTRRR